MQVEIENCILDNDYKTLVEKWPDLYHLELLSKGILDYPFKKIQLIIDHTENIKNKKAKSAKNYDIKLIIESMRNAILDTGNLDAEIFENEVFVDFMKNNADNFNFVNRNNSGLTVYTKQGDEYVIQKMFKGVLDYKIIGTVSKPMSQENLNSDIKSIFDIGQKFLNTAYKISAERYANTVKVHTRLVAFERTNPNPVNSLLFKFPNLEIVPSTPIKEIVPNADKKMQTEIEEVSFDSIGGNEKVKEELKFLAERFKNSDIWEDEMLKSPKGILMYGPPGTGKTMLAKALANEAHANIKIVSISDIATKWYGESGNAINKVFEEAKKKSAEMGIPTIIMFDEIDSIAIKRSGAHEESARIVSVMLQQMDGMKKKDDILVIGTTNLLESIDPALLRFGRFSKVLEVPLPDENARKEIFRIHLSGRHVSKIDYDMLAKESANMSGADIEETVQTILEKRVKTRILLRREKKDDSKIGLITTEEALLSLKEFKERKSHQNKQHNKIGFMA